MACLLVRGTHEQLNRMAGESPSTKTFTPKQGQYLAFIHLYTRLHPRSPAETDMQEYFRVSPPSVLTVGPNPSESLCRATRCVHPIVELRKSSKVSSKLCGHCIASRKPVAARNLLELDQIGTTGLGVFVDAIEMRLVPEAGALT